MSEKTNSSKGKIIGGGIVVVIILGIVAIWYFNPLRGYMQGKYFLDQNNKHGAVLGSTKETGSKECRQLCEKEKECGGVTWTANEKICWRSKAGDFLGTGHASEYAWVKK